MTTIYFHKLLKLHKESTIISFYFLPPGSILGPKFVWLALCGRGHQSYYYSIVYHCCYKHFSLNKLFIEAPFHLPSPPRGFRKQVSTPWIKKGLSPLYSNMGATNTFHNFCQTPVQSDSPVQVSRTRSWLCFPPSQEQQVISALYSHFYRKYTW